MILCQKKNQEGLLLSVLNLRKRQNHWRFLSVSKLTQTAGKPSPSSSLSPETPVLSFSYPQLCLSSSRKAHTFRSLPLHTRETFDCSHKNTQDSNKNQSKPSNKFKRADPFSEPQTNTQFEMDLLGY
uniref:Uncharacterized protein n=1 Tax=Rhizophora mucronata TaxID=61149 RepID=A0A2P2JQQ4_RHIMU